MKNKQIYIIAILVVAILGIGAFVFLSQNKAGQVACTMEAKICPDGSAVGRSGPKCEFAPCPETSSVPTTWGTFTDDKLGISFRYPVDFSTKYIQAFDWPPKVAFQNLPFYCAAAGTQLATAGRTEPRVINNHVYCVTSLVQGAAGSTYTQYAYAWEAGGREVIFTFSTRAPQCANYDNPNKTECENERAAFNIDKIFDSIAQTLEIK